MRPGTAMAIGHHTAVSGGASRSRVDYARICICLPSDIGRSYKLAAHLSRHQTIGAPSTCGELGVVTSKLHSAEASLLPICPQSAQILRPSPAVLDDKCLNVKNRTTGPPHA